MTKKPFGTTSKWTESIKYQLEDIENSVINTQFINIEQVVLDPNNHRTISCTLEEIQHGPKLPTEGFNQNNQAFFEKSVQIYFKNSENSLKKIKDYIELSTLAASIKTPDNLMNPITVYHNNNMLFNLVAGHRRTLAHYLMNSKKISARILDKKPSELDKHLLQWSENQDRENLTLSDQIKAINKIILSWEQKNNTNISLEKLISILSIKKTKAIWFLKLYRTKDSEVLNLINEEIISSLETAYKISCITNKEEKLSAINGILNGVIKNAKFIPRKKDRPPIQSFSNLQENEIGRRSKFKGSTLEISIKSIEGFVFFQNIIEILNNLQFADKLSEKDKELWKSISTYFKKEAASA